MYKSVYYARMLNFKLGIYIVGLISQFSSLVDLGNDVILCMVAALAY